MNSLQWIAGCLALGAGLSLGPSPSLGAGTAQEGPARDAGQNDDDLTPAEKRRKAQMERIASEQARARAERDARLVNILRGMQGGWQLVDFRSPQLVDPGRQQVGYMLVSDEFLSIEIHMAYFDSAMQEEDSYIQTGTYRLNFNPQEELTAMLLIGTRKSEEGYVIPTFPGGVTAYDVMFEKVALVLTLEDSTRLTFERMGTGPLTDLLYREVDWLPGAEGRELRSAAEASAKKAEVESTPDRGEGE